MDRLGLCTCSFWNSHDVNGSITTDVADLCKEGQAVMKLFAEICGTFSAGVDLEVSATYTWNCGAPDCCNEIEDEAVTKITVSPLLNKYWDNEETLEMSLIKPSDQEILDAWVTAEISNGIDWEE